MHHAALGPNLLGLAVQGSYAREEDREYSDLELVAFLGELPADGPRLDGEQIYDGMMVDLVWTTEGEYVASVKEVTEAWYIAGSDYLAPLVNPAMIERINAIVPDDLEARCLEQAVRRWPALYEATTKVLNVVSRDDAPDLGRLFFSVLDHVLVELAFLNAKPYISSSTTLKEALRLPKQPASLPELAAIAVEGAYTDRRRVASVVVAVLGGARSAARRGGRDAPCRGADAPADRSGMAAGRMSGRSHFRRLMDAPSAFCMRDLIALAQADAPASDLGRIYDWYSARTTKAIATSYAIATLAGGALLKYANDQGTDWAAVIALILVIAAAAFTGLFQLGRARAAAPGAGRGHASPRALQGAQVSRRRPRQPNPASRSTGLAGLAAVGAAAVGAVARVPQWSDGRPRTLDLP